MRIKSGKVVGYETKSSKMLKSSTELRGRVAVVITAAVICYQYLLIDYTNEIKFIPWDLAALNFYFIILGFIVFCAKHPLNKPVLSDIYSQIFSIRIKKQMSHEWELCAQSTCSTLFFLRAPLKRDETDKCYPTPWPHPVHSCYIVSTLVDWAVRCHGNQCCSSS